MPPRTPESIRERIVRDYREGKYSARELAAKYSISKTAVLRILYENNIDVKNHKLVNQQLIDDYFKIIDCEEKAYFLGFIFADGSVSNKKQLTIDINERDIDLLISFREKIHSGCKITTRIKGKSSMSRLVIKNENFVNHLYKYGIVPNKTENTKHLPINLIPKELRRHFLRGLIDGDGWLSRPQIKHRTGYHIGLVTKYVSTAQDFVDMINEFLTESWNNKILNKNNKYAVVQLQNKQQVKQLATALYADNKICLSRKFLIAQEIIDSKIC